MIDARSDSTPTLPLLARPGSVCRTDRASGVLRSSEVSPTDDKFDDTDDWYSNSIVFCRDFGATGWGRARSDGWSQGLEGKCKPYILKPDENELQNIRCAVT